MNSKGIEANSLEYMRVLRMVANLQKNLEIEQISIDKNSLALCLQCSNKLRGECIVTKPELLCSVGGIEKCSHYFKKNRIKRKQEVEYFYEPFIPNKD
jgi:hypothetical protein